QGVFYQAPLYPYLLGLIYRIAGPGTQIVRLVQAAIGAGSCWLLADAGCRLFSRGGGVTAGLALAFFGPSLFYEALIQRSVLDVFCICLSLSLAARLQSSPSGCRCWALGFAVGGLTLTRENGAVFIVVFLAWILLGKRRRELSSLSGSSVRPLVGAGLFLLG